jgi:hypothetical protein
MGDMSDEKIARGRARDAAARKTHFDGVEEPMAPPAASNHRPKKKSFLNRVFGL